MIKGLILEKNLPHQDKAIDCTTRVFSGISVSGAREAEVNPVMNLNNKEIMDGHITRNVRAIQKENNIDNKNKNEYIFDIQMETGTGKTYTYTKTIFELNIKYNLHKFIIVVPSLAIKAGTVNFLKNSSTKDHFRQEYNKEIKTYVVGGLSYSPDFAYVVEYENGNQKLNLVVETKGKDEGNLGVEEKQKIESARMFFETLSKSSKTKINLEFKPQLKNEKIVDIINGIIKKIGGNKDE